LRLALVNSAWPESWGGGEKWTIEAAAWFQEHGHEALVVARPDSRVAQSAQDRELHCIETSFGGDFDPLAVLRARRILKSHRADLVAVNFNKEAWQFGLAARMLGIPVVARHGFPLLRNSLHHRTLLKQVLNKVVVNAASIRDGYAGLGLPVSGIELIHNGTGLVEPKPGELRKRFGIATEQRIILAAGRLESQKRFDRVIEIAARVSAAHPELRFLIAGEGPLVTDLQRQINARSLTDQITLVGFLPDFAQVCGDADLFLLTSDNEGTPNVMLEAMAAGVPCVAFGVGAVPEILYGDLRSNVLSRGDTEAMTRRAQVLLEDEGLRSQVAAEMKNRVAAEFSLDASMRRFEQLFLGLLRGKS
jgi:glycosyltransferase involved in cell wall biosynthesis